ncbi:MAG: SdrD B-like domain-containing protein [Anaerolineae bacterium]
MAKVNLTSSLNTIDFGYQPIGTGSIGNFVWRDNDRDGIQDTGEPGIANILLTLYEDTDSDGVISPTVDAVVMTTTTNASGIYTFTNLPAGKYLVDVDTSDTDLPTDSFGKPFVLTTDNDPHAVTLSSGQSYTQADFGFASGGAIGDLVWRDDNRDGDSNGEPGISGVRIWLYADLNGDGVQSITDTLIATTTTSATGIYSFTSLAAGQYVVMIDTTTTPTTTFTYDLNGPQEGQAGVTLAAGQTFWGADFGLPNPNGSIGDRLWIDLDSNDTYETSEPGLAGVVITLTNSSGVAITTTTDADGYYLFPNLISGTYTVTIRTSTLPAGITQSFESDSSLDQQIVIALANSENNLNVDFGYVPNLNLAKSSSGGGLPLSPGATITYTIVVSNPSPAAVTDLTVTDPIPANTTYVLGSLTITPASAGTAGTPPTLVSPLTITAKSLVTLTYRVTITNPLPNGVSSVVNTAVLSTSSGITSTASVTDAIGVADLVIVKQDNPDPIVSGKVLTYTLLYTNLGSVAAQNVYLTDTLPVSVTYGGLVSQPLGWTNPPTFTAGSPVNLTWYTPILAAGASGNIVFTVTVNSGVSGLITNATTITTTTQDSDPTNNSDDEPTLVQNPSIAIVKTPDLQIITSGDTVTFTITVTNTGDVDLSGVVVSDPLTPVCDRTIGTLATGAITSYTCSVLNVTADFTNTAVVTGAPPTGPDISDTDDAVVELIHPAIGIEKTPDLQTVTSGDTVTFTITVTNTGHVTLTNVTVGDPLAPGCGNTLGDLVSGAFTSYTCSLANVTAGFTNTAIVTGTPPVGNIVTDTNSAVVDVIIPVAISGQVREDTDGDGALSDPDNGIFTVTITLWSDPNSDGDPSDGSPVLTTTTSITGGYIFTNVLPGNYVIVETDWNGFTSTADTDAPNDNYIGVSVTSGVDSTGNDFLDAQPGITIAKTPDVQTVVSGSPVTFTITVTNTGAVTLTNITVGDPLASACDRTIGTLATGAITSYTCTRPLVTVGFTNTAVVTGTPPTGPVVTNTDTARVETINPAIAIAKTPDTQTIQANDTVTFTITVSNTGDVDLSNVVVGDLLAPGCDRIIGNLTTGAITSYTCSLVGVTADFTNTATVTGTPPAGPDVSDTDDAVVDVINPGISLAKTPDTQTVQSSDTVTFTITVSNTGDVNPSSVHRRR